jgi:hypothetical protein
LAFACREIVLERGEDDQSQSGYPSNGCPLAPPGSVLQRKTRALAFDGLTSARALGVDGRNLPLNGRALGSNASVLLSNLRPLRLAGWALA